MAGNQLIRVLADGAGGGRPCPGSVCACLGPGTDVTQPWPAGWAGELLFPWQIGPDVIAQIPRNPWAPNAFSHPETCDGNAGRCGGPERELSACLDAVTLAARLWVGPLAGLAVGCRHQASHGACGREMWDRGGTGQSTGEGREVKVVGSATTKARGP